MNEFFEQVRIAFLGTKERPMNKFLKLFGILLSLCILGTLGAKVAEVPFSVWIKYLRAALFIVAAVSFFVAFLVEPKKPKVDRRFKTGFKDNAIPREKTAIETRVQNIAIVIGLISAIPFVLDYYGILNM